MRPGMASRKSEPAPVVPVVPDEKPEAEKVPYVDFVPPCMKSKSPEVKNVPPDPKNCPLRVKTECHENPNEEPKPE